MDKFLRKFLGLLKYVGIIIAGGLYIRALIILAENDNWVGISALTTMLLAIAAFWTIRQNYIFRKRERKERLLKEIIEWAVNVKACGLGKDISDIASLTEKQLIVHFMALVSEKIGDFKIVLALGDYILKLVENFFKADVIETVKKLVGALDNHIKLLEKLLKLLSKPITAQTFKDFTESVKDIVVIEFKEGNDETADSIMSRHINELWKIATNAVIDHKKEKVDPIAKEVIDEATKLIPE